MAHARSTNGGLRYAQAKARGLKGPKLDAFKRDSKPRSNSSPEVIAAQVKANASVADANKGGSRYW